MKHVFFILFLAFSLSSVAQVSDRTETNCMGESRSIYDVGESGRPLIIASKGFDCSICQNQADNVLAFADANAGNIEVWAAMTFTYSSSTPTCGNLANWTQTHNWNENIFSFIDEDEYWLEIGTPRYYVIHPQTHDIIYEGSSFNAASQSALGIALSTSTAGNAELFKVYHADNTIIVEGLMRGELTIYNIVGQVVDIINIADLSQDKIRVPFSNQRGIYIAELQTLEGSSRSVKFVVQ